jgi:hypothetical protein
VLVEGPSKRDPAVVAGRTAQGKLVHFAPGAAEPAPGAFGTVTVTGAAPHHLRGTLVGLTARPRHRTRLAVAAR